MCDSICSAELPVEIAEPPLNLLPSKSTFWKETSHGLSAVQPSAVIADLSSPSQSWMIIFSKITFAPLLELLEA